jgi:hypothetical protein
MRDRPFNAQSYSGFFLLALIAFAACFPVLALRSMAGFSVFAMAMCAFLLLPASIPPLPGTRSFLALNAIFVALGMIYVALSYTGALAVDTLLPLRTDYILRHAFFLFLWIPFGLAAYSFWRWNIDTIVAFFARYGLLFCALAGFADIATSKLFGYTHAAKFSGYAYYLEKLNFGFLLALAAATYLVLSPRRHVCAMLIVVYAAACQALHLGIAFNTQTGVLLFLVLMAAWNPTLRVEQRAWTLAGMLIGIHLILLFCIVYPDTMASDVNATWRFHAWQANIRGLWNTALAGAGFGTPYHPLTPDTLRNTMFNEGPFVDTGFIGVIEPQYVRGQHSSFVNIFYRMGLAGGIVFTLINGMAVWFCLRGIGIAGSARDARICLVALAVVAMQIIQMSLHVGLETPRFVLLYALGMGMALCAYVRAAGGYGYALARSRQTQASRLAPAMHNPASAALSRPGSP